MIEIRDSNNAWHEKSVRHLAESRVASGLHLKQKNASQFDEKMAQAIGIDEGLMNPIGALGDNIQTEIDLYKDAEKQATESARACSYYLITSIQ